MSARWLPQPFMSLLIAALWLALTAPAGGWPAPGSLAMALVLGLGLPLVTRRYWPNPPRLHRPLVLLGLGALVAADIVRANLVVARQVLGPPGRLRPAFFTVPLAIADPFVATLLGGIISLTPGTVTIDIEHSGGRAISLLVHGLDVPDAAAEVAMIKARYEARLQKAFGC